MPVPENFADLLRAHRDCTERLLSVAEGLEPSDLDLCTVREAKRIRRMVSEVQRETQRMKGFVRLTASGDRILYGYMKPQHRIGFRVASFFAKRFPETVIVLGNPNESWVSLFTESVIHSAAGGALEDVVERLGGTPGMSCNDIWSAYYSSQETDSDMRAFQRHMPKKALQAAGCRTERSSSITYQILL